MNGWQTLTSAALSVAYGAAGFYFGMHDATVAVGFINAGIATAAIGVKIDRAIYAAHEVVSTTGQVAYQTAKVVGAIEAQTSIVTEAVVISNVARKA